MSKVTKLGLILFLGGTLLSLFLKEGTAETISILVAILGLFLVLIVKRKEDKVKKEEKIKEVEEILASEEAKKEEN